MQNNNSTFWLVDLFLSDVQIKSTMEVAKLTDDVLTEE